MVFGIPRWAGRTKNISLEMLLAGGLCTASVVAEWPQFRGPDGQGHSNARGLPTRWDETKNITWKVRIPGKGFSSPVISGNQIWMTTALEEGRSLRAICIHLESGQLLYDVEVFHPTEAGPRHSKNSFATPTPVLEGGYVYVHFGSKGTACLSADGEVVWKKSDLDYHLPHGPASSPVLFENLLILTCDGTDTQFIVALDKSNGDVIWKSRRQHLIEARSKDNLEPDSRRGFRLMSYSTPLVIEVKGVPQLVSTGADYVAAYHARTGREIWWYGYNGFSEAARPVYAHGIVFVSGMEKVSHPMFYAIRPDARGRITVTQLAWKLSRGVQHVPSPLVVGDELYLFNDRGVSICLDARTGREHWKERIGGNYSASPIYADGHIYICSEEGKTSVLAPGKKFKLLATNELDGQIMASPAAVGQALFLRTAIHLYRIENWLPKRRPNPKF